MTSNITDHRVEVPVDDPIDLNPTSWPDEQGAMIKLIDKIRNRVELRDRQENRLSEIEASVYCEIEDHEKFTLNFVSNMICFINKIPNHREEFNGFEAQTPHFLKNVFRPHYHWLLLEMTHQY